MKTLIIALLIFTIGLFAQNPVAPFGNNPVKIDTPKSKITISNKIEFKNFKNDRAWNLLGLKVKIIDDVAATADVDSLCYLPGYYLEDHDTIWGDTILWKVAADTPIAATTKWIDINNDSGTVLFDVSSFSFR